MSADQTKEVERLYFCCATFSHVAGAQVELSTCLFVTLARSQREAEDHHRAHLRGRWPGRTQISAVARMVSDEAVRAAAALLGMTEPVRIPESAGERIYAETGGPTPALRAMYAGLRADGAERPRSPEEDLAAAMARLRVQLFQSESGRATRGERQSAAWHVQALRAAGWRILRNPTLPNPPKRERAARRA